MRSMTLKVTVGKNGHVHKEGFSRRVLDGEGKDLSKFTEDDGVFEVPNTKYYRQALIDGDLVVATGGEVVRAMAEAKAQHEEQLAEGEHAND